MNKSIDQPTILSIMQYLKSRNMEQSWLTIEKQANIKLYQYPKQIQFLRKLLLEGEFKQTIRFFTTLQNYLTAEEHKTACLRVYTQWLCELIEQPNEEALKDLFERQLVEICTQEQYQQMFGMLTCRRVQDLQGLRDWTVMKGRLGVFKDVVQSVQRVLGYHKSNNNSSDENASQNRQYQGKNSKVDKNRETFNLDEVVAMYRQMQCQVLQQKQEHDQKQQNQSTIMNKFEQNNFSNYGLRSLMYNNSKITNNINNNPASSQLLLNPTSSNYHQHEISELSEQEYVRTPQAQLQNEYAQINTYQNDKLKQKKTQVSPRKQQIGNFYHNNQTQIYEKNSNQMGYKNNSIKMDRTDHNIQHKDKSSIHNQKIDPKQSMMKKQGTSMGMNSKMLGRQYYKQEPLSQSSFQNQPHEHQYDNNFQTSEGQIEYLQQTNSIVYNNQQQKSHENFTFSHHNQYQHQTLNNNDYCNNDQPNQQDQYKPIPKIIKKLASTSDPKAIRTCQFSSSGQFFALGTNSSLLKIFQVDQLYQSNKYSAIKPIYEINNIHTKSIFCLDWAQDQKSLVTCSNDLTVKLTQFTSQFQSHNVSVIGRHQSCIRMVKYSHDQQKIFSCGDDGLVKVWDMGKVKRCYNLKGHNSGINAFKICQNSNQLYSVSKDATIKRWDLRSLQCISTSDQHESEITYIASNTQKIVVSNKNGNVLFYDDDLNLEYEVKIHQEEIRSIEGKNGEDLFITGSFDGHVALFGQKNAHEPDYFQHNDNSEDKVVFATFLNSKKYKGFASTSTLGICNIYSYC